MFCFSQTQLPANIAIAIIIATNMAAKTIVFVLSIFYSSIKNKYSYYVNNVMVIFNKIVRRSGNEGYVSLPQNMIGMEVYVISKEDFDKTGEFLDRAIIKQKVYEDEVAKLKTDLEQFKNISNARITYLEKIISFTTSQQQVNPETQPKT